MYSDLKIEPTSAPSIELTRLKDSLIWNISFSNVFNTEDSNFSLVNLDIGGGCGYRGYNRIHQGKYIHLYRRKVSYWIVYPIKPYSISKSIRRGKMNTIAYGSTMWRQGGKGTYIYLDIVYNLPYSVQITSIYPSIEANETKSDIYMASISDEMAYKITPANSLNPKLMKWTDGGSLYFMNVDDSETTLFQYDVDGKKSSRKLYIDKNIESFDIEGDKILLVNMMKPL